MSLLPGLAHLPAARAVGGPSVNVIHHPKLIPVVIAAVVAVLAVWIGISLSRWRRPAADPAGHAVPSLTDLDGP